MKEGSRCLRSGRLIRLVMIACLFTTAAIGYSLPGRAQQPPSRDQLPELSGDDGFAMALFYGSDINGDLEPCG